MLSCVFQDLLRGYNCTPELLFGKYANVVVYFDVEDKGESKLDNEGVTILFWEHLMEYELSGLRDVFWK